MIDKEIIAQARQLLVDQNKEKVIEIANRVIADGHDPLELMNEAFIPGINEVGDLFGRGRLFLPELMVAADAMKAVTDVINAALPKNTVQKKKGTVLLATVKGDVHDIGKCIVVSLMRANGFTVHDLGRDIDIDTIIEKAVKERCGYHRHQRPFDHHHGPAEKPGAGLEISRPAGPVQDHGGRCPGHRPLGCPDRCRRLCRGCPGRRGQGQGIAGTIIQKGFFSSTNHPTPSRICPGSFYRSDKSLKFTDDLRTNPCRLKHCVKI